MNALAQQMLGVAKRYLGPAAPAYLSTELRALGVNANTVTHAQLPDLVEHIGSSAARTMGEEKAAELAAAIAALGAKVPQQKVAGDHRLASDAAAKLLASGKLRAADTAYRELVQKHGDTDSYRGLARTLAALGDEAGALATLREASIRYASDDRTTAVTLLAEAVALVPHDLAAHRRLAAALANQGDLVSAVEEYARFVDVCIAQKDPRRAMLELSYGRETLGDLPGLFKLVDRVTGVAQAAPAPTAPTAIPRPTTTPPTSRAVPLAQNAPAPQPLIPPTTKPQARPPQVAPPAPPAMSKAHPLGDRLGAPVSDGRTRPDASHTAVVLKGAKTLTHAEQVDLGGPVNLLERAGLKSNGHKAPAAPPRPARPPVDLEAELACLVVQGNDLDAASIAASRASMLIAARDVRATSAALDAARRLLGLGKLQSASDVLLDYIGHGFCDREAQRLLIEVDCAIGRRDYAKEKCQLLSYAYRLDGRTEVAEDVERLARIL